MATWCALASAGVMPDPAGSSCSVRVRPSHYSIFNQRGAPVGTPPHCPRLMTFGNDPRRDATDTAREARGTDALRAVVANRAMETTVRAQRGPRRSPITSPGTGPSAYAHAKAPKIKSSCISLHSRSRIITGASTDI